VYALTCYTVMNILHIFIAHAQNGHMSTCRLKSDVTIVFLGDFRIYLRQILLTYMHGFSPLALAVLRKGQNKGKSGAILTPQRTRSYFSGFIRLCQFWWKSIKKSDRESARRRTDTHTDRHTHRLTYANRLYNLSHAICYSSLHYIYLHFIYQTVLMILKNPDIQT